MLCLKFAVLIAGATLSATEVGQAAEWRAAVSAALGRAPDQLELLDRSPLSFAFVSGRYAVFVVRDLQSTEVLEVTINLENEQPVKELELRELEPQPQYSQGSTAASLIERGGPTASGPEEGVCTVAFRPYCCECSRRGAFSRLDRPALASTVPSVDQFGIQAIAD